MKKNHFKIHIVQIFFSQTQQMPCKRVLRKKKDQKKPKATPLPSDDDEFVVSDGGESSESEIDVNPKTSSIADKNKIIQTQLRVILLQERLIACKDEIIAAKTKEIERLLR